MQDDKIQDKMNSENQPPSQNIADTADVVQSDKQSAAQTLAICKRQKQLRLFWLLWLLYRGVVFAILLNLFLPTHPNIMGGIAWQIMLLIPAFILTPWMTSGKSPYALLIGSMVTLVYLGASGVTLFTIFYGNGINVWWVYAVDTVLLFIINLGMFRLLKILPSMNNVQKKPRH